MYKILLKTANSRKKWRLDKDTGFLRVTARLVKAGAMSYSRAELADIEIPDYITADPIIVALPLEEMQKTEFLNSIEGTAATHLHAWQDTDDQKEVIGNFAGAAKIEGEYLIGDFVIKDKAAIEKIMNGKLTEISSAYSAKTIKFVEKNHKKPKFHAYIENLNYNHTAFIPIGTGRAGLDVKVLNQIEPDPDPDPEQTGQEMTTKKVFLSNSKLTIEVEESKADELIQLDAKISNMVERSELEAVQAAESEAKKQLKIANERIAQLEDPSYFQNQLTALQEVAQQADLIIKAGDLKIENRSSGDELKEQVVTALRVKNQLPAAAENEISVMFKAYFEQASAAQKADRTVPKIENQQTKSSKSIVLQSPEEKHIAMLYGDD